MAKFHINTAGVSGQCRATQGGCPFGGDDRHYDSPEEARSAFEKAMERAAVPKVSKRTPKPYTPQPGDKENYDPEKYGGYRYDQIIFDAKAVRDSWTRRWKDNARLSRATMEGVPEAVDSSVWNEHKNWKNAARTDPAKSYERDVPIRLLPVGTEVEVVISKKGRREIAYKIVGTPVDNGGGDIVGKYRDSADQWDYVQPATTFKLGEVPEGKKISLRWDVANKKAADLQQQRDKYQQDMKQARKTRSK